MKTSSNCLLLCRATSFYPSSESKYDYLALRAFNIELSNVAASVRSNQLGQIRFQWWRDAVKSLNSVRFRLTVCHGVR